MSSPSATSGRSRWGDVWLANLDPAVGHEEQGTGSALIATLLPLNVLTGTPVDLPIATGGSIARRRGSAVSQEGAGTRTTGMFRCNQPRALDIAARTGKCLDSIAEHIMDELLARLVAILN